MLTRKQIEARAQNKFVMKRDGTVEFKRGFFYTNGYTSDKFAAKLTEQFPELEVVSHMEYFKPWPKDSYWSVIMKQKA